MFAVEMRAVSTVASRNKNPEPRTELEHELRTEHVEA